MGATKRMGRGWCTKMSRREIAGTKFAMVRSQRYWGLGSVLPFSKKANRRGGPVTVTTRRHAFL